MKDLIKKIFIDNWPRKCLSLAIAIVIWFSVDQSLTTTRIISDIGVRIVNLPDGKTVEGMQPDGLLGQRVTLTITGKKTLLEELDDNDFEILIDAKNREGEWIATIDKRNLVSLNPDLNLQSGVQRIAHKNFIIKLTQLTTAKVPIIITPPIGETPRGYRLVDVWPNQLDITVSGPQDVVRKLKTRGIKLTFNLSDIAKDRLDQLEITNQAKDAISFVVPDSWKMVSIPELSSKLIKINDPNAKNLRIDFVRYELLPVKNLVPVSIYYPPLFSHIHNPTNTELVASAIIEEKNGLMTISKPLYAKGVSELFVQIMQDMLSIDLIIGSKAETTPLDWSLQFVDAQKMEDRYVKTLMSDASLQSTYDFQPEVREAYLRHRFRKYLTRFQLYLAEDKPLKLEPILAHGEVYVEEKSL